MYNNGSDDLVVMHGSTYMQHLDDDVFLCTSSASSLVLLIVLRTMFTVLSS